MQDGPRSIVWFRRDLRLADNPALTAAATRGPIIPVFLWSPRDEADWPPGAASRWWLHESLHSLSRTLRSAGSRLIVRRGEYLPTLREIVREVRADAVFWNRRYDPSGAKRDREIETALCDDGQQVTHFNATLLREPGDVLTKQGLPYQVFTAYWRACAKFPEPAAAISAPRRFPPPASWPNSLEIEELELTPRVDWTSGMRETWRPGETGAQRRLVEFLETAFSSYPTGRDRPGIRGTSRLSPHLHAGEISPRQIWHAIRERQAVTRASGIDAAAEHFLRELGWREFAHQLLHHFPHTSMTPLRTQFAKFPWKSDSKALRAWQRGETGYPIVDAGMRELWSTGWMHNRVRMIVGSFLVKHLLIDWREGAAWFWDTLVDADLANNTLGWQWVAGCGADAAPYFRIFNPVLQGQKFDPRGDYVRRWVPELTKLEADWIHAPWEAPPAALARTGLELDRGYPRPIVDHAFARRRALGALQKIRVPKSGKLDAAARPENDGEF
ncbi:MAG: deoxyribodipyrimidine photo-lyase [Phycisphaerae bacterium]